MYLNNNKYNFIFWLHYTFRKGITKFLAPPFSKGTGVAKGGSTCQSNP